MSLLSTGKRRFAGSCFVPLTSLELRVDSNVKRLEPSFNIAPLAAMRHRYAAPTMARVGLPGDPEPTPPRTT